MLTDDVDLDSCSACSASAAREKSTALFSLFLSLEQFFFRLAKVKLKGLNFFAGSVSHEDEGRGGGSR